MFASGRKVLQVYFLLVREQRQRPGAEQAAEKGWFSSQKPEKHPSGTEDHVDFIAFMYGLKPVPFTGLSFSASCEAPAPSRICCLGRERHYGTIVRPGRVIICKRQGTGNIRTRKGGFVVCHPFHDETVKWVGHPQSVVRPRVEPGQPCICDAGLGLWFPGSPPWRMDREHPDLCLARCGPSALSKKCCPE
jgi:hypothetical protein